MAKKKTKTKNKLTTIYSILAQEDVRDTINRINEEQNDIMMLVCLYYDTEGGLHWRISESTTLDDAVALLEKAKLLMLLDGADKE